MTCPCGKPLGHTGRHRIYLTEAAKRDARHQVKLRCMRVWRQRQKARGLCASCCVEPVDRYTRCLTCREKDAAQRSQRRRREAA
jgi:hypothetical protein